MERERFFKRVALCSFIIMIVTFVTSCNSSQVLFQENDGNWMTGGDAEWAFSDGEVVGTVSATGTGFIMTEKKYNDYVLEAEFKPDDAINSGIFIRCKNQELSAEDCYEMNIWDGRPDPIYRTGGIVAKAEPLATVNTNNKWNTYKIEAKGNHLRSWINGTLMIDMDTNDGLIDGYIGLQATGEGKAAEIRFRNIKLKSLD